MVEKKKKLFQDKVVVITGASSGLGYRIAKEFIRENARLSICARRLYKLKKIYKSKAKVFFQKVDISDERAIKKFIKKTVKIFGKIDILINNAGILIPERRITSYGVEMTFAVNHVYPFLLTHL